MNQPTREEFEELKSEVAKLKQQQTEPIKLTIDRSADPLLQIIYNEVGRANTDIGVLKGDVSTLKHDVSTLKHDVSTLKHDVGELKGSASKLQTDMEKAQADILAIKESQADQRDTLKEHSALLKEILSRLPKQDE